MGTEKSLDDRIAAVKNYCKDNHVSLGLEFDPVSETWDAFDGEEQLTGPCAEFHELIEALEAEFAL